MNEVSNKQQNNIENLAPDSWRFWGTLSWGALILIMFVTVQSITAVVFVLLSQQGESGQLLENFEALAADGDVLSICTLASFIVCCLLIWVAIICKRGATLVDYLALRSLSWRYYVLGFVALVFLLIGIELINWLFDRDSVPEVMKLIYLSADSKLLLFLAIVVLAPLFEEVFFRGFLYRGLLLGGNQYSQTRVWTTIVITSAVWALIHLQYEAYDMGIIFIMGIVLGVARWLTGSLYLPIFIHAVNNFASTLQIAYLTNSDSALPTVVFPGIIN